MQLALCNEMFGDIPLGEVARRIKRYGYKALEVAPFSLGTAPLSVDAKSMRAAVEKTGLRIMGLHWLLAKTAGLHAASPDDAVRKKTVAHLIALADLCKAFGGDILVFGSPAQRSAPEGATKSDTVKRLSDTFAEVGSACKERSMYLCIEPLTPRKPTS